jgi:hypothetical protein
MNCQYAMTPLTWRPKIDAENDFLTSESSGRSTGNTDGEEEDRSNESDTPGRVVRRSSSTGWCQAGASPVYCLRSFDNLTSDHVTPQSCDGDTHSDILLSNASTGDVGTWIMNGSTISSGGFVGPLPLSFEIRGL